MSTDDDYRDMKPQGEWVEYVGISDTTNNTGLVPIIQAFCPEILPSFMGPPSPVPAAVPVATMNPLTGVETKSTLRQTTLLTCEYLGGDNHLVPCIYKGERVRIFNYGGSDKFYWLPLGREPGMRRHEHLRWFAMSQPKGVEKGVRFATTDLNSYFVDIKTIDKALPGHPVRYYRQDLCCPIEFAEKKQSQYHHDWNTNQALQCIGQHHCQSTAPANKQYCQCHTNYHYRCIS